MSPCHLSCHDASGEMLKCWHSRVAGQRGSFSSSTSPGQFHSLVMVKSTWGFSCPLEGPAVPIHLCDEKPRWFSSVVPKAGDPVVN